MHVVTVEKSIQDGILWNSLLLNVSYFRLFQYMYDSNLVIVIAVILSNQ